MRQAAAHTSSTLLARLQGTADDDDGGEGGDGDADGEAAAPDRGTNPGPGV
jgi:hypothetical protein